MQIAVQLDRTAAVPPEVIYTWDADTEILSAHMRGSHAGYGVSGSLGVEGRDGSWLILDLQGGRINAVEVAVWPDVHRRQDLQPPDAVEDASVSLRTDGGAQGVAAVEVQTSVVAALNPVDRVYHFRLGPRRQSRTVRLARDILLDIDRDSRLAGLWLLNVPPCPTPA